MINELYTIRFLEDTDLNQVYSIFNEAMSDSQWKIYTRSFEDFHRRMKKAHLALEHSLILLKGEQIIGFCLQTIIKRKGGLSLFLIGIGILPVYRNQKLGSALLFKAKNHAQNKGYKSIVLEYQEDQFKQRNFYKSMGFKDISKNYSSKLSIKKAPITIKNKYYFHKEVIRAREYILDPKNIYESFLYTYNKKLLHWDLQINGDSFEWYSDPSLPQIHFFKASSPLSQLHKDIMNNVLYTHLGNKDWLFLRMDTPAHISTFLSLEGVNTIRIFVESECVL